MQCLIERVSYKHCKRTSHLYVEEYVEYLPYNECEESEFLHSLCAYLGKGNLEQGTWTFGPFASHYLHNAWKDDGNLDYFDKETLSYKYYIEMGVALHAASYDNA